MLENKRAETLRLLRESGKNVSGQELCEHFGISRTAVWKMMNQLKEEGYEIEAVQNKGYRLLNEPDLVTKEELESRTHTKYVGQTVYYSREVDSTNTWAKRLAEGREYVEVLPRMSLEQVAQVLAGARAVVSVDTGLSHLTAALDKPNFTLYGPTDPGLIGGYGKNQHIVRPENSASTGDITASRVHLLLQNQGLL